jgi:glutaredoxin 3
MMAKIEIYTSPFCGFCWRAKSLLQDKGAAFDENGSSTVPQIFIDDAHIGGCDELLALDHKGGLDPLLQAG